MAQHITWREIYDKAKNLAKGRPKNLYVDTNFFVSANGNTVLVQFLGEKVFESDGKQIIICRKLKEWSRNFLDTR